MKCVDCVVPNASMRRELRLEMRQLHHEMRQLRREMRRLRHECVMDCVVNALIASWNASIASL